MGLLTVFIFVLIIWGLGYSVTFFLRNVPNIWERQLMRWGIGIGVFIVLGVLLNLLRVSLDWRLFLVLALLLPAYTAIRKRSKWSTFFSTFWSEHCKLTKENVYIVAVLAIFVFSLYMYASGAFSYPYLENDDPWHHAASSSYVKYEKTLFTPQEGMFKYLYPYPPGFALVMGVLAQTADSLSWTLKFLNALIISLGGIFFYFAAKHFTGSGRIALFSLFVLASLPSFFTHFIWAHTLVVMLFFPALYCLEMIDTDRRWMYASMVAIAAILLTQHSKAFKIGILLFIYFVVKSFYARKLQKEVLFAQIGGVLLSLLWWYDKAFSGLQRHQAKVLASGKYAAIAQEASVSLWGKLQSYFPSNQGTATRAYTFHDFFVAEPFGMINVHVGWGIVVSILVALGLLYIIWQYKKFFVERQQYWVTVVVAWFIFTFFGTNSMTFNLPLGLFAFRFWLLLAIPVALLSWLGVEFLLEMNKKLKINIPAVVIVTLLVLGIFFTSTTAKYNQNAKAIWPPGQAWASNEEVQLYVSLNDLPKESKIFSYSGKGAYLLGMDHYSCDWCAADRELRQDLLQLKASELHSRLKAAGYDYLLVEAWTVKYLQGKNYTQEAAIQVVNEKLQEIANSGKFVVVKNANNGGILFRVL